MRISLSLIALCGLLLSAIPALASLPYYNADMGYTIWLPGSWVEKQPKDIEHARVKPLPVHGAHSDWEAGYVLPEAGCSLLVGLQPGRKMNRADISNFNHFLVRTMKRLDGDANGTVLKGATYIKEKKVLRLESELIHDGNPILGIAYVVYTRKGLLTFVGYVDPDDDAVRESLDKAVFSLYLDDSVRYDPLH